MRSLLVSLLLSVVCICVTCGTASKVGRHRTLLAAQLDPNSRFQNSQRAQAATSQAIIEAVNAGGTGAATARAGNVGGVLAFAAAQNNQDVFDALESQQGGVKRRSLLQRFGSQNNLNANTLRAQAATSQAITEAVAAGGSRFATRRAGAVGSQLAFAASQNNDDVFDATDRAVTGRKLLKSLSAVRSNAADLAKARVPAAFSRQQATVRPVRHLLQFSTSPGRLATNTLRSQAATAQAITEAVNSGADRFATRRAGRVGSDLTFAAAQNNQDVFDLVERG